MQTSLPLACWIVLIGGCVSISKHKSSAISWLLSMEMFILILFILTSYYLFMKIYLFSLLLIAVCESASALSFLSKFSSEYGKDRTENSSFQ